MVDCARVLVCFGVCLECLGRAVVEGARGFVLCCTVGYGREKGVGVSVCDLPLEVASWSSLGVDDDGSGTLMGMRCDLSLCFVSSTSSRCTSSTLKKLTGFISKSSVED